MHPYDPDPGADEHMAEIHEAQCLVNNGAAWQLEGAVGRHCMYLIEAGYVALGHDGHHDYWGSYVPSRYEVEPGTKGSVEYVEARSDYGVLD